MIAACRQHNTIFTVACHLNWYGPYTGARDLIARGELGRLRSLVCHSPHSLSNIQSHTLALFRLFAGAPARWVFGHMDDETAAADQDDLSGSGYIVYENGVRAILNTHASEREWLLEFICDRGRIVSRNQHAWFELWTQDAAGSPGLQPATVPVCLASAQLHGGRHRRRCPVHRGRRRDHLPRRVWPRGAEIAIALRESHRRGGIRVDLPLPDRSLRLGTRR